MIRIARLAAPVVFVLALSAPGFCQGLDPSPMRPLRVAMGDMEREDAHASDQENSQRAANVRAENEAPIVWTPPVDGSPRVRVAGGVRGATALPTPMALVPEHVALTTRHAPSLFWHIDAGVPEGTRLFFTLVEEEEGLPLVEVELAPPAKAGIQRVLLADHSIELDSEITYQWSISLVPDIQHRSADVVATGYIQRVAQPEAGYPSAQAYAAAGLWYDALETLSDAVDASPEADGPRAQRRSLLRQAGLRLGAD
ncbi:MAG: DUF928 domain-containing protein [Myxococcales bacterium]|nr:DUF928 domain-containing protein [Myxococcales bacterium]